MNNTTLLAGIVIVLVLAGGFLMLSSGEDKDVVSNGVGGENVQKITLGVRNGNYHPSTITAKEGQPVSITLDSSVGGCLRSFTIRELGVHGYSKDPSETIDFTPAKKGTFRFACSMGMGYGTIVVE